MLRCFAGFGKLSRLADGKDAVGFERVGGFPDCGGESVLTKADAVM